MRVSARQQATLRPGPRSRDISAVRQQHVATGPFHTTPIVAAHAEGAVIAFEHGYHGRTYRALAITANSHR